MRNLKKLVGDNHQERGKLIKELHNKIELKYDHKKKTFDIRRTKYITNLIY